uniref:Uncharacterized protein LOC107425033 n=1 Tax=Rhizophora mucronata TaxID=61149 RepID=A0A2P2P002_RHIMU
MILILSLRRSRNLNNILNLHRRRQQPQPRRHAASRRTFPSSLKPLRANSGAWLPSWPLHPTPPLPRLIPLLLL